MADIWQLEDGQNDTNSGEYADQGSTGSLKYTKMEFDSDSEWNESESDEEDEEDEEDEDVDKIDELQLQEERDKSKMKLKTVWEDIILKYSTENADGDVVDIMTGEIVEDHGHLHSIRPNQNDFWINNDPSLKRRITVDNLDKTSRQMSKKCRRFIQMILGHEKGEPRESRELRYPGYPEESRERSKPKEKTRSYPVMTKPSCQTIGIPCSRPFCSSCA